MRVVVLLKESWLTLLEQNERSHNLKLTKHLVFFLLFNYKLFVNKQLFKNY